MSSLSLFDIFLAVTGLCTCSPVVFLYTAASVLNEVVLGTPCCDFGRGLSRAWAVALRLNSVWFTVAFLAECARRKRSSVRDVTPVGRTIGRPCLEMGVTGRLGGLLVPVSLFFTDLFASAPVLVSSILAAVTWIMSDVAEG